MRVSSVLKQKFYCQALSNYSKTVKGKARGTKGTDSLSRRVYCSNPNYDCTMSPEGCLHHLQGLFFKVCTKYVKGVVCPLSCRTWLFKFKSNLKSHTKLPQWYLEDSCNPKNQINWTCFSSWLDYPHNPSLRKILNLCSAIKRPQTRSAAARQVHNAHERDLVTNKNV